MDILPFVEKNLKLYRNFRDNLGTNVENLRICICWGIGGGAPEASEFIKILGEKSMETYNFLKIFMNYERVFYLRSQI